MTRPLAGLSAFALTPSSDDGIETAAYARVIRRLAEAGVDSIGALGSIGSAAYLSRQERALVARIAVENADGVPVVVGVGALRTREILAHVEDAQRAGASALLLPAMTYQPLTDDEVYGLFEDVAAESSIPLVVYDNPVTTGVHFSDDLHGRVARLPGVASIKIPPVTIDVPERMSRLRQGLPDGVGIGMSGDGAAAEGLLGGCDTWYSVLGGVLPDHALAITRAAQAGSGIEARALASQLQPVWDLFAAYGSYRVVTALAEEIGLIPAGSLPRPIRPIDANGRDALRTAIRLVDRG